MICLFAVVVRLRTVQTGQPVECFVPLWKLGVGLCACSWFRLPGGSLLAVPGRFSVACFGVSVSVTVRLTCVHISFGSVSVAEWPPFGK